jgi:hypothetical protein
MTQHSHRNQCHVDHTTTNRSFLKTSESNIKQKKVRRAMNNPNVAPLDRSFPFVRSEPDPDEAMGAVTYALLAESPDKIENWTKKCPRIEPNVTQVLSLASVNNEYVDKSLVWKWPWDLNLLAIEKVEGRGRVSFEHVVKPRTEISLTYFGNVLIAKLVSITNVAEAKEKHPILMRPTAESELEDMIQLDDTYTLEEVVAGYKTTKLDNIHFKNFLEEETERLLDDNGFVFSDDGESYSVFCMYCECTPCVWTFNEQMIIDYDKATHDEETAQNTRRHAVYRQMALYINGGPSGSGNRLKLPICVLTGVRNLFPDPDAKYTGHRDLE